MRIKLTAAEKEAYAEMNRMAEEQDQLREKYRAKMIKALRKAIKHASCMERCSPILWVMDELRHMERESNPPGPPKPKRNPSASMRKRVFERDKYRCLSCGGYKNLQADHVIPFSKGGPTTEENLQTLCGKCNGCKGNKLKD